MPTFEKAEAGCFAEKHDIWRSHDPANGRRRAMDRYVLSRIGAMPVDKVGSATVLEWARIAEFRAERLAGGDDAPLGAVVRPGGSGVNYPELGLT